MDFKRRCISKLPFAQRQFTSEFRTHNRFWLRAADFVWSGPLLNAQFKDPPVVFQVSKRGPRWRPEAEGLQSRKPIPPKIRRVLSPLQTKSYVGAKLAPVDVVRKLGEGVPAEAPFSSSDRGSSQNNPRVASKRDVTIAKLN
ncbi:hypothetical protein AVEN_204050-1 [Araneus ventricosus]|uniref:Uncharacterized protein n=1 Tax=Araneus ventricosus TaxID=182803 RepID=A0A4Y2HE45_ARAVE|nr:hypothetical protein AVEN_143833-1 [Araneus ventricosus]GBM63756.1 hypothetical protein AVEN_204050-1 [Araneus ventricosus]